MDRNNIIRQNYVETQLQNDNNNIEQKPVIVENQDTKISKEMLTTGIDSLKCCAPIFTYTGIMMLTTKGSDRFGIGDGIRLLGIPVAIGGIVVDVLKFPVTTTFSLVSFAASAIFKIKSFFTKTSKDGDHNKEILDSFNQRFANTMKILVSLNLETPETIADKINDFKDNIKSKKFLSLCALTLLNSAFASRRLDNNSILLSNGKILHKKHCPKKYLPIFDVTIELRNALRSLGLHNKSNSDASPIIIEYIPIIKNIIEDDNYKFNNNLSISKKLYINKLTKILKITSKFLVTGNPSQKLLSSIEKNSMTNIENMPSHVLDINNNDNNNSVFIDFSTKEKIVYAVIGDDGNLYNLETAKYLINTNKLNRFTILYSAGAPLNLDRNSDEFIIDQISCDEIKNHVVCNDGRIYDRDMALNLIQNNLIGIGAIKLTDFIECPNMLKW